MLTRNHILIRRPKDEVFDVALKTLKEMGAKINKEDKSGYYIQSKTTSWNRITGSKLEVFVWDDLNDSILDVYDHSPEAYTKKVGYVADERFLGRFFKVLPKYIPYNTKYGIEVVKEPVKQRNPSLMCTVCNRDIFAYTFQNGTVKMCKPCLVQKFGNTLLTATYAQYYGGHKAYLAGGMFSDSQTGSLVMTENYLIFQTNHKDNANRWEIFIPFKDVIVSGWGIEEVTRRKQVSGFGGLVDVNQDGRGDIAMGGGFIHESGKAHHLVVPYVDQNGIPQQPRFGISSLGGKAIREWSAKLYERVVELKKKEAAELNKQNEAQLKRQQSEGVGLSTKTEPNEDPIHILKIRLAKGEITKEQYDELRKVFES